MMLNGVKLVILKMILDGIKDVDPHAILDEIAL